MGGWRLADVARRSGCPAWLLALGLTLLPIRGLAVEVEFMVVGHVSAGWEALGPASACDFFLGSQRVNPSGGMVVPIDQRDEVLRQAFYRQLCGLDVAEVRAIWSKLLFTGKANPPRRLGNDEAVLQAVAGQTGAVGYVRAGVALPERVRVLLRSQDLR